MKAIGYMCDWMVFSCENLARQLTMNIKHVIVLFWEMIWWIIVCSILTWSSRSYLHMVTVLVYYSSYSSFGRKYHHTICVQKMAQRASMRVGPVVEFEIKTWGRNYERLF
jgi:hypothetical protein